MILSEAKNREPDFFCMQELDQENFNEFFRAELATSGYRGVYWPKTRAGYMSLQEQKSVDGCATFFKNDK